VYAGLSRTATTNASAASSALSAEGVPHRVPWAGSKFSIFFREGGDYDDAVGAVLAALPHAARAAARAEA
jgi:glutamate-1-semialdehyde 2,1-aminomutase